MTATPIPSGSHEFERRYYENEDTLLQIRDWLLGEPIRGTPERKTERGTAVCEKRQVGALLAGTFNE